MNTLIRNLVCFTAAIGTVAVATAVIALTNRQSSDGGSAADTLAAVVLPAATDATLPSSADRAGSP